MTLIDWTPGRCPGVFYCGARVATTPDAQAREYSAFLTNRTPNTSLFNNFVGLVV